MIQHIVTYLLLAAALAFLAFRYLVPKKKKKNADKNCDNCG